MEVTPERSKTILFWPCRSSCLIKVQFARAAISPPPDTINSPNAVSSLFLSGDFWFFCFTPVSRPPCRPCELGADLAECRGLRVLLCVDAVTISLHTRELLGTFAAVLRGLCDDFSIVPARSPRRAVVDAEVGALCRAFNSSLKRLAAHLLRGILYENAPNAAPLLGGTGSGRANFGNYRSRWLSLSVGFRDNHSTRSSYHSRAPKAQAPEMRTFWNYRSRRLSLSVGFRDNHSTRSSYRNRAPNPIKLLFPNPRARRSGKRIAPSKPPGHARRATAGDPRRGGSQTDQISWPAERR